MCGLLRHPPIPFENDLSKGKSKDYMTVDLPLPDSTATVPDTTTRDAAASATEIVATGKVVRKEKTTSSKIRLYELGMNLEELIQWLICLKNAISALSITSSEAKYRLTGRIFKINSLAK